MMPASAKRWNGGPASKNGLFLSKDGCSRASARSRRTVRRLRWTVPRSEAWLGPRAIHVPHPGRRRPAGCSRAPDPLGGGRAAPLQCAESPLERREIPCRPLSLGGVVVALLFLVLLDASVELVNQQINGGIHVFRGGVRMDGAATHVQCCFSLLLQLFYGQHTVNVDDLIEVPCDAIEFFLHITA